MDFRVFSPKQINVANTTLDEAPESQSRHCAETHQTVAISDFSDSQEHPRDSDKVDYEMSTLMAQGHRESTFITMREIHQEEATAQSPDGGTRTALRA